MKENKTFPGSKWWKFEFHAHTPRSDDYPDKNVGDRDWLLAHMRAGYDAVVVTDHNSGEALDKIKQELNTLRSEGLPEFRELLIFPGVELAASGGIHVLLILDPGKGTSDVAGLIRSCGYQENWGSDGGRCIKSLEEIIDIARQQKALVIPAHVDIDNGIWKSDDMPTIVNILNQRELFAIERYNLQEQPLQAVRDLKKVFAEIAGSDSHDLTSIGQRWTWVKMTEPSMEGLRLALLDGPQSIRRSDQYPGDPNSERSSQFIESFEVDKAKYIGHVQSFNVEYSPWLTAIIGGRGTGKSSLLEFMRIALRREQGLERFDDLREEFEKKYAESWNGRNSNGLQTEETEFRLIYRKDNQRYRIGFDRKGSFSTIEEEDGKGGWRPSVGDIYDRFPVSIFSQKQIFALADSPDALLAIIDQDPKVEKHIWESQWNEHVQGYRKLMGRFRELKAALADMNRVKGQLDDSKKKLKILEESKYQKILKSYQQARTQLRVLELWSEEVEAIPDRIREFAQEIKPSECNATPFDPEQDADVLKQWQHSFSALNALVSTIEEQARQAELVKTEWNDFMTGSAWRKRVEDTFKAHQNLVEQLKEQGVNDLEDFSLRLRERQGLEEKLKELEAKNSEIQTIEKKCREVMDKILKHRRRLSEKRNEFLSTVLANNPHIRIKLVRFGAYERVVDEYREKIGREDERFSGDILDLGNQTGILKDLYDQSGNPVEDFEDNLMKVKERTRKIVEGSTDTAYRDGLGNWFLKHLESKVKLEDLDDLDVWFPEDRLEVTYRSREGGSFVPISQGSPGQKTAALLTFILSYGSEPLILDQPEDDLDNRLIYNLVTRQLIENKPRRQMIVVTHNANIVVNGDAELVIALESSSGQTACSASDGLGNEEVRKVICDILEGGREAFEFRYRRIKEGLDHV